MGVEIRGKREIDREEENRGNKKGENKKSRTWKISEWKRPTSIANETKSRIFFW